MKLTLAVLPLAFLVLLHPAAAFAPSRPQLAVKLCRTPSLEMTMSDEEPAAGAETEPVQATGGAIVAVSQENIELTAGILGGTVGLVLGGPFLAAITAAAANYFSKSEGNIVGSASKSGLEIFNKILEFNSQYEITDKVSSAIGGAFDTLKSQQDPDTVASVEKALGDTKDKISEFTDEYDPIGAGMTALGVVGDLVEKTANAAGDLNEQYELTDKAKGALDAGIEQAGISESLEQVTTIVNDKVGVVQDKLSEAGIDLSSGSSDDAVDGASAE